MNTFSEWGLDVSNPTLSSGKFGEEKKQTGGHLLKGKKSRVYARGVDQGKGQVGKGNQICAPPGVAIKS